MSHPNEDLVRRGYAAFAAGDVQTLDGLLADGVRWHAAGKSPVSGDFSGKGEVLELFRRFAELSDNTFRSELHDVLANDEHVVALTNVSGKRGAKTLDGTQVTVFHVREGQVTEAWLVAHDQMLNDEFWS